MIPLSVRLAADRALLRSDHPHKKHAAVLFTKSGRVLSIGWNIRHDRKTASSSIHAEVMALRRLGPLKGKVFLYSEHVSTVSVGLIAKPCPACWKRLKAAGIYKIIWTDPAAVSGTVISLP